MLAKTETIDLVTQGPDIATYQLVLIVDKGEWDLPNCKSLLQEKVNAYLVYAFDGQMREDYPNVKVGKVEIIVNCEESPPQEMKSFLQRLQEATLQEGVPIRFIRL